MIALEIISISIALIAITNVHYGSANKFHICVELISEEPMFRKGVENRVGNFQRAFRHLSIDTLNQKYAGTSRKKVVQRNLIVRYFNDLKNLRISNIHKVEFPSDWCTKQIRVIIKAENNVVNPEILYHEMNKCQEYTTGYLFQYAEELDKDGMFIKLYNDWTEGMLLNAIGIHRRIELSLTIDMTALYIENYTLAYFNNFGHYADHNRHSHGDFRSIEQYCLFDGHNYVLPMP